MGIEFHRDGPWELPEGWAWARLGDLVEVRREKAHPDPESRLPFVGMDDVPTASLSIEKFGNFSEMRSAGNKFYPGDILYGRLRPYLNKVVVPDFEGAASGEFITMRPKNGLEARFIQMAMHSRRFVNEATRDTTGDRPRVGYPKIASIEIPVAPSREQQRIVARVDELFTEIADGETTLARARTDLDTWRRALLKAAVTGELTRDWREQIGSDETGFDVLDRVAEARRANMPTRLRARRLKEEKLVIQDLPTLPQGWAWARLGDIGEIVGGVTVDKKRKADSPTEVPYLRVANVQRGYLALDEMKSIVVDRNVAASLTLQRGDILLNEGGDRDKIGRGWVWEDQIEDCIHQNHVFRVRLYDRAINPFFVSHYANELGRRFFVENGRQTTNLASINLTKVSQLPVPIGPIAEMQEAMRILDELLLAVEDVEKQFKAAAVQSTVRHSILKAAFEGRLVDRNPSDEPAERLLARLSVENPNAASRRGRPAKVKEAAE